MNIVHGEVSKMEALAQGLKEELAERFNEGSLTVRACHGDHG